MPFDFEEIKKAISEDDSILATIKTEFKLKDENEIAGLLKNQTKLKDEKLKLKAKLDLYTHTPEEIEEMEQKLFNSKGGELSDGERFKLSKLEKEVEATKQQAKDWQDKFIKSQKTLQIDKILEENNISKAFRKVLHTDFDVNSKYNYDEGSNAIEVFYKSEKGDIPLSEFAKEFFGSEDGKAYIAKPENTGSNINTFNGRISQSKATITDNIERGKKGDPSGYIAAMNQIESKQIP